jgi:hypothetical protein
MRKNMSNVIESFVAGRSAQEKTCRTDGETVWSYEMPIAHRAVSGTVYVVECARSLTNTTRSQVRALESSFPNALRVLSLRPLLAAEAQS